MAKKSAAKPTVASPRLKSSALVDTRVIYCGDNLEQLKKLPDACVDLIYIDPPFNSNRNYEVFWGETKEKRSFEDRHESTTAYIDWVVVQVQSGVPVAAKTFADRPSAEKCETRLRRQMREGYDEIGFFETNVKLCKDRKTR